MLFRTALLVAAVFTTLLLLAGPASAQTVVNSASDRWLETQSAPGEGGTGARAHVTLVVKHDPGLEVTGLRYDTNYDGTDNTPNAGITAVTAEQPPGSFNYSRVSSSVTLPNPGAFSCPIFGTRTRRVDRTIRVRARLSNGTETGTLSANVHLVANGQCLASQDYPFLFDQSQSATHLTPGDAVSFTFTGDDADSFGGEDNFGGINWRWRRLNDGAIINMGLVCFGNSDNTPRTLNTTAPGRGRWVAEAELRNADNTCLANTNSGRYFRLGAIDVNTEQSASPNGSITGVPARPQIGQTISAVANVEDADDASNGGDVQMIEWDADRNATNGPLGDGFERRELGNAESNPALTTAQRTQAINTTGVAPGTYTVRARITDNGAINGADNIRRTRIITATYKVDTPPTANPFNGSVESDATLPISLVAADADDDPLTYSIIDPPDHGALTGSGPNRTYDPNNGFAGTDTFTFQVADGFGGTATAVVTIRVTPATNITAAPDTSTEPQSTRAATFEFSSPVPGVTFQCRLDDGAFETCESPLTYEDLSDGNHDFAVRAVAGGTGGPYIDPTPDTRSFQVDAFPVLTITQAPDSSTSSTSATIEFTASAPGSNDPVTTECRLDNGPRRPCESPATFTDLSSGSHSITVYATDSRGKEVSETRQFQIDADAPVTNIDSAPPVTSTSPDAEFAFSSSEPNSTFECALDTVVFTPCSSPQQYTGLSEGDHTFRVRATDSLGSVDPTPATHTFTIDTTPPETTASAAPAGPTRTPPQFTFSSDPNSTFQCRIGTAPFEACTSPYDVPGTLDDGEHTFEVRATDAAGNADATPESRTFTLDRSAPTTVFSGATPDEGSTISEDSATFDFSSPDGGSAFECSADGGPYEPCSSGEQMTGLEDGDHTFAVRSRDAAGNTGNPATRSFSVDVTEPQTQINSGPAGTVRSENVTFTFSSPNGDATEFRCSLDGALFEPCTSPKQYTGLSDGSHTFRVAAGDEAANFDQTPAQRTFTVDTSELPAPNEPPDPPVDPEDPDCTFGEDLATCGPPSMTSKLKVFPRTGRANVILKTDTGGAAVSRAVFRLPNTMRVVTGGAGAGKGAGALVLSGGERRVIKLTVPAGRNGDRALGSDATTQVVLRGRKVIVTTSDEGVTNVNLRLHGRPSGFLTTKKRCGTLAFRVTLTDSANKKGAATARADAPCPRRRSS